MNSKIKNFIYLLFFVVVLGHVYSVSQSFVDIPYRDSWQIIQDNLGQIFPVGWFLAPHNEHIIFFTKLQVWLLFHLNSWNVVTHLWLNLAIYFAAIFAFYRLFQGYGVYFVFSLIFLFSNLNWENLSWEFQSCFHFFVLFLILTVSSITKNKFYLASFLNLLMLLSFSAAVGASLALLLLLLFKKNIPKMVYVLFISPCLLYLLNPSSSSLVLPYRIEFWDFFLNLVSFGYGFETYSWFLGLNCLFLILVPFAINLKNGTISASHFLSLALLASLAIIAVGRAGNEDIHIWSKGARYFEISSILVPCALVQWLDVLSLLRASEKRTLAYVGFFLLVPLVGSLDNWNYSIYKWIGEQKVIGRNCMRESRPGEVYCRTLWNGESSKQLSLAKRLELSFIK